MRTRSRLSGGGRGALVILLAFAAFLLLPGQTRSDITGDGTDEIGVFGVELAGRARGPWYQVYDADGSLLSSKRILANFHAFQFVPIDTDGDGTDELVLLAIRNSDGAAFLQVRSASGVLLVHECVTEGDATGHQLFAVNSDGGSAVEIGIGFTSGPKALGNYGVWKRSGSTLTRISSSKLSGKKYTSRQWRAADFDGDGKDEIFVGHIHRVKRSAEFLIGDPETESELWSVVVTGSTHWGHQWVVGDFDLGNAGMEVLVGTKRSGSVDAWLHVYHADGSLVGEGAVTGSYHTGHEWGLINNGTVDLVFVAFKRVSDRVSMYEVWDPSGATPTRLSHQKISAAYNVEQWLTGNFDGVAANGDEVMVGFRRLSDGAIGFQVWDRGGSASLTTRLAYKEEFTSPHFLCLSSMDPDRHELLIRARRVDGNPKIQLWDTRGPRGTRLLKRSILNADTW